MISFTESANFPHSEDTTPLGRPADALMKMFSAQNTLCWLDSGTLLGVCRDGRPPFWDKDLDLAMWLEDLDGIRLYLKNFAKEWGYNYHEKWLKNVPYAVLLRPGFILTQRPDGLIVRKEELPISIHLFKREHNWAISAQPHNLLALDASYARFRLGRLNSRELGDMKVRWRDRIKYGCVTKIAGRSLEFLPRAVINRLERPDASGKMRVHPSERFGAGWLFELFVWKVPEKYFADFVTPATYPDFVKIPKDYEQYLQERYGQWREPVQEWLYTIDDGLLINADQL